MTCDNGHKHKRITFLRHLLVSSVNFINIRTIITMFEISHIFFTILLWISFITRVFSQLEDMTSPNEKDNMFQYVSRSNDKFCNTFYSNVAKKIHDNVACSPLSAHVILSLVATGAQGRTAEELKSGLYLPTEDSLTYNGFKSLLESLNNITEVELNIANTIYFQENVTLVPHFLSINSQFFYCDTPTVDFGNSDASAKEINSWVKKKTNNKIDDIISADDINEQTRIILVNAIYFKGIWMHQFRTELTKNRPFYITKDVKTHVPTMSNKFKYAHGEVEELNARIIELPYSNKDFSMLILLPNEIDGLQFLEMNFKQEHIGKVNWQYGEIELFLPKFKIEATIHLKEILQEMGMKTMFSDLADFSGIAQAPLQVDKLIQKAFIEVNEEGSEAAAATVVGMRIRRMAVQLVTFQVDRPFMFTIQHKPSKIPVFVGSIRNLQMLYRTDEL